MENFPTWRLVVAGALQRENGQWLMHKRPLDKQHGGMWEFPGGKVEYQENPPVTLARELAEELGIAVDPEKMRGVAFACESVQNGPFPIVILLYKISHWDGVPQAREGGDVGWFTPAQIAQLDKPPLDIALAAQLLGQFQS